MKGKIVLVPFPFSDDFAVSKPRPAVCLTEIIGKNKELIIAYITSRVDVEDLETDFLIDDFKTCGLKLRSKVKLHKLVAISVSKIKAELGSLDQVSLGEIDKKLATLFGL